MARATNKCFATTNLIAIRMIGSGVTDLVHRLIHGTLLQAAGGLEPTSNSLTQRAPTALLGSLFRVPRYCFTGQRD
jgi:hypothetical protein